MSQDQSSHPIVSTKLPTVYQCVEPMLTDNLTVDGLYGKCSFDSYDQVFVLTSFCTYVALDLLPPMGPTTQTP
jgi:hypothetical protein